MPHELLSRTHPCFVMTSKCLFRCPSCCRVLNFPSARPLNLTRPMYPNILLYSSFHVLFHVLFHHPNITPVYSPSFHVFFPCAFPFDSPLLALSPKPGSPAPQNLVESFQMVFQVLNNSTLGIHCQALNPTPLKPVPKPLTLN